MLPTLLYCYRLVETSLGRFFFLIEPSTVIMTSWVFMAPTRGPSLGRLFLISSVFSCLWIVMSYVNLVFFLDKPGNIISRINSIELMFTKDVESPSFNLSLDTSTNPNHKEIFHPSYDKTILAVSVLGWRTVTADHKTLFSFSNKNLNSRS